MEEKQTDLFGIISIVIGVLTWLTCFGSCIPYLNILTMFPSMLFSLLGTILGVVGWRVASTNEASPALSLIGAVLNGVPFLIWICYWIFVILALIFTFVMVFLAVLLDTM